MAKGLKLLSGLLKVTVPTNWSTNDDGKVISIGSPDNDAAINVSHWHVQDRSVALDASGNLEAFMQSIRAQSIERTTMKPELAQGRFRGQDGAFWTATFYYDCPDLVLVTSTISPAAGLRSQSEAHEVISSLQFRSKGRFSLL